MGYYTTFHAEIVLRKDIPKYLTQLLTQLVCDNCYYGIALPEHPLFKCERWPSIFSRSGFLNEAPSFIRLPSGYYRITLRSVLKNYDDEIEKFVDWISPFIAGHKDRTCVGWQKGEIAPFGPINLYVSKQPREHASTK